jgi:hypothetical protein
MIYEIVIGASVIILAISHHRLAKATGARTSNQERSVKLAHHRIDKMEASNNNENA